MKKRRSMKEISKDIEKNNKKRPIRRKTKPIGIDDVLSMLIFDYMIDVYDRDDDSYIGTYGKDNIVLCPEDYIYRPAVRKGNRMEELLVIIACLNSKGCSETANAYYQSKPEIRKIVQENEEQAKKYVGPVVIQTVGPAIFYFAGGTGNIKLNQVFRLQVNKNQNMIIFNREF